MADKLMSTFDREMLDHSFREKFEKEYNTFVLSEIIDMLMTNDNKTVRKLADEVSLSPTVIQKLRSGKQDDVKLSNFVNLSHACGFNVILEKGSDRIFL